MGAPVVHFEIIGKDAPALRTFYCDTFGWQIGDRVGGAGIPDYTLVKPNEGTGIGGGIGTSPEGYGGHVTFYVGVPDVAKALDTVEQRGGTKMMGPDDVPGGFVIGLFQDPEGHVVGLVEIPAA
jgi:uncharacterized protein